MCYDIDNDDNYKQMLKMIEEENYSEFINKVINMCEPLIEELDNNNNNSILLENYSDLIFKLHMLKNNISKKLVKNILNTLINALVDRRDEYLNSVKIVDSMNQVYFKHNDIYFGIRMGGCYGQFYMFQSNEKHEYLKNLPEDYELFIIRDHNQEPAYRASANNGWFFYNGINHELRYKGLPILNIKVPTNLKFILEPKSVLFVN